MIMIGAAQRYRELLVELLLRRAQEGGELSPAEEAHFASALDLCWNAMTDAEQEEIEDEIAAYRSPPDAPQDLAIEDLRVDMGASIAPRKAA
jgi:hypothetical protein